MKEQIRQLILKCLLAADGIMTEPNLRTAIRRGLSATVTEADITIHIQWCEREQLIIGTADGLVGTTWALTTQGRLKAAQLQ